jgi:hypothetical protein
MGPMARFTPHLVIAMLFLIGCSSRLPTIDNPNLLAKDGHALLGTQPVGNIDPAQWPASVKKLNPVEVRHHPEGLIITTFRQTGSGMRGYIVADKMPELERFRVSPTPFPDIYSFEFQP